MPIDGTFWKYFDIDPNVFYFVVNIWAKIYYFFQFPFTFDGNQIARYFPSTTVFNTYVPIDVIVLEFNSLERFHL